MREPTKPDRRDAEKSPGRAEISAPVKARRGRYRTRALALVFGLLVAVLMLEMGSWLLVTTGALSARVPSYSLTSSASGFWGDLRAEFGPWHPPETRYLHQKSCFSVVYESNSYGARDVERAKDHDQRRVVVLGDSFMEGYGVDVAHRLSNVLEAATLTPHLNFGSAGQAGSTHSFALYTSLAAAFRHDAVIASILPENDFDDDQPKAPRYQPYWSGRYPDYELKFTLPSVEQSTYRCDTSEAGFDFSRALREYTYTKNVTDYLYSAFKQWRQSRKLTASADVPESRFFRYSREEFDRLRYSYEQLAAAAYPRPVVLFTIPRHSDFGAVAKHGRSPLDDELRQWAAGIENVHFVALMPELRRRFGGDLGRQFLSCDAHWSAAGHAAVAEILLGRIGKLLYGE